MYFLNTLTIIDVGNAQNFVRFARTYVLQNATIILSPPEMSIEVRSQSYSSTIIPRELKFFLRSLHFTMATRFPFLFSGDVFCSNAGLTSESGASKVRVLCVVKPRFPSVRGTTQDPLKSEKLPDA